MAIRRRRLRVVLDTNVLVAALLTRDSRSPNLRVYRMWGERQLQLILSDAIQDEYLALLARLGIPATYQQRFTLRLRTRRTVTHVHPRRDLQLSRDPSDNTFLAAAVAGKAHFLVTNDLDLLDVPAPEVEAVRLRIVTPTDFLRQFGKSRP